MNDQKSPGGGPANDPKVRKSTLSQTGAPIESLLKVPPMDGLTPNAVADLFLKSEEFYVERALRVVSETFELRLRNHIKVGRPILTESEINTVFLNISQIYDFNRKLYDVLLQLRLNNELIESVGTIMIKHIPFFKLYTHYIKEYRNAQKAIDILADKRKRFDEFLELNEMCAGHALQTMLLAPVCRLPQYLLFLGSMLRSLDQNSATAQKLIEAVKAVQTVTDDIAFSLRDQVARRLVVTVQQKIFKGNCDLISPHRYVVKHSDLKKLYNNKYKLSNGKQYLFVLFNDMLLYGTKPGKITSGEVKHALQLNGMSIEEMSDTDKAKNAFKINSNSKSFIVAAPNGPVKQSWIKTIREEIASYSKSAGSLQKSQLSPEQFEKSIKQKAAAKDSNAINLPTEMNRNINNNNANNYNTAPTVYKSASSPIHRRSSSAQSNYSSAPIPNQYNSPPPMIPSRGAPSAPPVPARPPASTFDSNNNYDNNNNYNEDGNLYDEQQYNEETDRGYSVAPPPPVPSRNLPPAVPTSGPPIPPRMGGGGSSAPAAPPMAPAISMPAKPAVSSARGGLLDQIQAGKQLKSAQAGDWKQIRDPDSGEYYYENVSTGETTWDRPAEFGSGPGAGGGGGGGGGDLQDTLKNTLDRYRQFVQDEEDTIKEGDDDEWNT